VLDWDALYYNDEAAWARGEVGFEYPEFVQHVLHSQPERMSQECPLGFLYYVVLDTYRLFTTGGGDEEDMAQAAWNLRRCLSTYPFFVVTSARWATFEALHYFSPMHEPRSQSALDLSSCVGVQGSSGIDWTQLREAAEVWGQEQLVGFEPGEGLSKEHTMLIQNAAQLIWKDRDGGVGAQEECPFGFIFICATQVLASSIRRTGAMETWARALDSILAELPFFSVAGSKWPTLQLLAMQAAVSKGRTMKSLGGFQADVHRWGTAHPTFKRFRGYGDLRLWAEELAPFGRDKDGWSIAGQLASVDMESWYLTMKNEEPKLGKLRPVFASALEAVYQAVRSATLAHNRECGHSGITKEACEKRGCTWDPDFAENPDSGVPFCLKPRPKRKVVGVSFVWGERWATLVPGFVAWMTKLDFQCILVAMGEACRKACETAVQVFGTGGSSVSCWDPFRGSRGGDPEQGSILQRHAMVHLLLHLGFDVIAFDFDTFWFSNPRVRFEELADETEADVMMTRHLDADCFNMGLLYIRSSSQSAEWYSRYLEWLHQHPYEREQRGVNSLLGFTDQAISFPPKNMPKLKIGVLDDHNEFSSSRGGWLGDWSKLRFFHWVNPVNTVTHWSEIKFTDIEAMYDCALHHSTFGELARQGPAAFPRIVANADATSLWAPIRDLMNSLTVKAAPTRQVCW